MQIIARHEDDDGDEVSDEEDDADALNVADPAEGGEDHPHHPEEPDPVEVIRRPSYMRHMDRGQNESESFLPPPLADEVDNFHEDIFVLSLAASHTSPVIELTRQPPRTSTSAPSSPFGDSFFAEGMGTLKRLAQRKKKAFRNSFSPEPDSHSHSPDSHSPRYSTILSEQPIPLTIITKMDHGRPLVMEGSAEDLLLLLGSQLDLQTDFVDVFLCTFRYFTTPAEVLDALTKSHRETCLDITSEGRQMDKGAIIDWNEAVERHILTVLVKWYVHHYRDFENDEELDLRLRDFLQSDIFEVSTRVNIPNVLDRLDRVKEDHEKGRQEAKLMIQYRHAVEKNGAAVMRKTSTKSIFDISTTGAARALCQLEMDTLQRIPAWELSSLAWVGKTCERDAPLLYEHIYLFNKISNWVATEVVFCQSLEQRASLIEKFIAMARQAREWNNFNTSFQIVLGLQNPALLKLRATWAKVGRRHVQALQEMNELVNPERNHRNYRTVLASTFPPCVPYVGMYLKDLVFANDGSQLILPNGHINFGKLNTIGMTVLAIRRFQDMPYPFEDDSLLHWFRHHTSAMSDEELMAASKNLHEPSVDA